MVFQARPLNVPQELTALRIWCSDNAQCLFHFPQARKAFITTADNGKGSLLVAAADGGSAAVFSKVVRLLDGEVGLACPRELQKGVVLDINRLG